MAYYNRESKMSRRGNQICIFANKISVLYCICAAESAHINLSLYFQPTSYISQTLFLNKYSPKHITTFICTIQRARTHTHILINNKMLVATKNYIFLIIGLKYILKINLFMLSSTKFSPAIYLSLIHI